MKVSKYLVDRATLKEEGGVALLLKKLELGRLDGLGQMLKAEEVTRLELDGNFLKQVQEADIRDFLRLEVLTASLNFISKASSLTCLQSLRQLDLSTNRLRLLSDLSALRLLEYLDISHNQVKYVQRLPPSLKVLRAGNNLLEDMGFLPQWVQSVDLSHNFIESLSELAQSSGDLRVLNLQANNLPLGQFPNLLIILERYCRNLKELVLSGNAIAASENYVLEILNRGEIEKLQGVIVTPYIRKAFTEIKQQRDIEEVIKETHSEYLRRIKDEVGAKQRILESLKAKQQQVESLFSTYRASASSQMDTFVEYCNKAMTKDGKELQFEHQVIMSFEKKLKGLQLQNTFEERSRRRKILEDQLAVAAAKVIPPQTQLYGRPGYSLPDVRSANDPSIHEKGRPERSPQEEYTRKTPIFQQLEGLSSLVGQQPSRLQRQQPSTDPRQPVQPSRSLLPDSRESSEGSKMPSDNLREQAETSAKGNKRINKMSAEKLPLGTIQSRQSQEEPRNSSTQRNRAIRSSIMQSKRASVQQRLPEEVSRPTPTEQLFSEECWECFERYYSQPPGSQKEL